MEQRYLYPNNTNTKTYVLRASADKTNTRHKHTHTILQQNGETLHIVIRVRKKGLVFSIRAITVIDTVGGEMPPSNNSDNL